MGIVLIIGGFAGFTFSEFIAARREARREAAREVGLVNESRENALSNSATSVESECYSTDEHSPLLKEGRGRRRWLWNYVF